MDEETNVESTSSLCNLINLSAGQSPLSNGETTPLKFHPFEPFSTCSWREIGISPWLIKQLEEFNLRKPTPVQTNCIPKILEGSDVLGCAKTGTGKTLAFALPILQQLAIDPFGIFALILTPTRELALQIGDQFAAFGRQLKLQSCVVIGGRHQMAQAQELSRRPHVLIATPGRLADHIESDPSGIARLLKTIRFLVLDEADRMLDGQYATQLKVIFDALPTKRQTLLFSATLTSALNRLHEVSVRKPYFFEEKDTIKTVDKLEQRFVLCPRNVKDAYLVYVVKEFYLRRDDTSILVFAKTCRECQALALMFKQLGFEVGSLHSEILQSVRAASLAKFRAGRIQVLICTDVASRGLDIPHVDLVVNHNVPRCPKAYVHRVGRSARAGRFGAAVSFVTQYDVVLLKAIEGAIGKKMDELKVNHKEVALYAGKVLATKREAEIRLERRGFGERREIWKRKELAMEGLEEDEIERRIEAWKSGPARRRREEEAGETNGTAGDWNKRLKTARNSRNSDLAKEE
uniref:RNA helicase n=1 Tax=Globodera pallida TaxID=36090 RepID=A0A183BL91_GLOPA